MRAGQPRTREETGRPPAPGARGYSWAAFEAGNMAALRHGAGSPRKVRPLAEQFVEELRTVAPWTARPAFDGALRSLALVEAQLVLLRVWIDEHGILGADAQPQAAFTLLQRLEAQVSTPRAELGLTPQALARLLGSLVTVATADRDDGGLAARKAEGQRIVAARHAALGPVDAEETS